MRRLQQQIRCMHSNGHLVKNKAFHRRLGFAIGGILHALRSENSFRFQTISACVVLAALFYLRPAPAWWAIIFLTVVLVLAAELMNTAVELLADHLHPEQHPRIKGVKDCAAGAVLITSVGAIGVAVAFVCDFFF
jgi:diacylglycerol kinase (ATP)